VNKEVREEDKREKRGEE